MFPRDESSGWIVIMVLHCAHSQIILSTVRDRVSQMAKQIYSSFIYLLSGISALHTISQFHKLQKKLSAMMINITNLEANLYFEEH